MAVQSSVACEHCLLSCGFPLLFTAAWQLRPTGGSAGSFRLLFFWPSRTVLSFLNNWNIKNFSSLSFHGLVNLLGPISNFLDRLVKFRSSLPPTRFSSDNFSLISIGSLVLKVILVVSSVKRHPACSVPYVNCIL